jgi:transposase-like protein
MNVHKNARLTPHGRERIVRLARSGQVPTAIASLVGVCPRTVRKWLRRYREEGLSGLSDRSSRPHRLYRPLRPGLPNLPASRRRVASLAAPIQLAPTARQPKIHHAYQPPHPLRGQPIEAPQLATVSTPTCQIPLGK